MQNIIVPLSGVAQKVVITESSNQFQSLTVFGYSGFTSSGIPVNNQGLIIFGFNSTEMPYQVTSGTNVSVTLPDRSKANLNTLWMRGNNKDGAYILSF